MPVSVNFQMITALPNLVIDNCGETWPAERICIIRPVG